MVRRAVTALLTATALLALDVAAVQAKVFRGETGQGRRRTFRAKVLVTRRGRYVDTFRLRDLRCSPPRTLGGMPRVLLVAALIGCSAALGCSQSRPEASAPPPAARGTVLWAIGDGGTGTVAARDVQDLVADARPARVIFLGDVYDEGTREEFVKNFDAVYGDLVHRMWPTPGNHEWANRREGYDAYWRRIRGGRTLPHWYERRIAGWQVLSLNSEGDVSASSLQLRWLRARLRAPFGTCRIAFWHRPRFSAGRHGDQEDVDPLWDAVAGRAALVLAGHDHDLQRLKPIAGTVAVVSGAGGRHRYSVDEDDPRLAFSDDEHFGALRIELRGQSAILTFVAADGSMLDRSSVGCRR